MAEAQQHSSDGLADAFSEIWVVLKNIFSFGGGKSGENFLDYLVDQAGRWNISRALFLILLYIGLWSVLSEEIPHLATFATEWIIGTAAIWLPVSLWLGAWRAWVWYVQSLYISGRDGVVLEVKMPREIAKSPRAMEVALSSFWINSGQVTYIHRAWRGQMRPWFSLELASFGGEVHFYIWCWKAYKEVAEAAIYAQYPEVEVEQVEDYASKFKFDGKKYKAFCMDHEYGRKGANKSDAYPIKSYIEFELDKDPEEEFIIDPLAQVLEYLSALRPHEQAWIQILFRLSGDDGVLLRKSGAEGWRHRIDEAIEEIRTEAMLLPGESIAKLKESLKTETRSRFPHPTWAQTHQIEILQRNQAQLPFDVVMRAIFIADVTKGSFDGPMYTNLRWLWRPYNDVGHLNALRPRRGSNDFDYPWADFKDIRFTNTFRRYVDAFRRRSGFYSPWVNPIMVMSPETIASLWHPPSAAIEAPGLARIPATKAEPPPNLPI